MDSLVNYKLFINRICLKNNYLPDGKFSVDPRITRKIDVVDETHSAVTYELEIKNSEAHSFPIDLEVSLTGVFDISKLDEKSVDDFLKVQTCQILFPQIRSIVANITASSMMVPLLLPIVDARKLFENENN